jgi:hypothetical protein
MTVGRRQPQNPAREGGSFSAIQDHAKAMSPLLSDS